VVYFNLQIKTVTNLIAGNYASIISKALALNATNEDACKLPLLRAILLFLLFLETPVESNEATEEKDGVKWLLVELLAPIPRTRE
jgi:hypothetical protein